MEQERDERSLGELFQELSRETSTLIRQEMDLAKAEMTQKVQRAGKDAGFIGAGGAIAYAGFIVILGGVAILLGEAMPLWLATLVVGLVVVAVGGGLVLKGKNDLQSLEVAPRHTVETLKEDKEWAKEQTR
jgi:hypothetical protein